MLANGATWVDADGKEQPLTLDDIMIITPYNAQVFEIQQRLPGARVGTVDKFQGQEAPIAIYSTATSSHADAPRGMEFLYSLNRFNVATSRAKCISILVSSPQYSRPNAAHHGRFSLPMRSAAIWKWPTGSAYKHRCCQKVGSARRHLPRRPDRQFQYLAQGGQARIPWPTTVRLPVVNARCTDTDLIRHFGDRKTTPNSCFPKIATEGRFAGHRSSPFRIVDWQHGVRVVDRQEGRSTVGKVTLPKPSHNSAPQTDVMRPLVALVVFVAFSAAHAQYPSGYPQYPPGGTPYRPYGPSIQSREAAPLSQAMLNAHNAIRARVGVPPLVWSEQLAEVAQDWANHLIATGGCRIVPTPATARTSTP